MYAEIQTDAGDYEFHDPRHSIDAEEHHAMLRDCVIATLEGVRGMACTEAAKSMAWSKAIAQIDAAIADARML